MHRASAARWLLEVGVCLVALGVLVVFALEWLSYGHRLGQRTFFILQYAWLPTLFLGLLITFVGSIFWAWQQASVPKLAISGVIVGGSSLLTAAFAPIHIHDWTGSLIFVVVVSLSIGLVFLIFAAFRLTASKLTQR